MGRDKFIHLVEHFGYVGEYTRYARMDVIWERVRSVERTGSQEVADLTVPGPANVVANGMVVHNTFIASIGICRILYELSCMKDPHASFGLAKDTNISIVCLSVNESLATKVVYENIVVKIKASEYFKEHFPFEATKKELRFPNSICLNTISGLIDEGNFLPKRQTIAGEDNRAESLYNAIKRRMKSRFERQGKLPGMLFIVSSKRTHDDFTAKRIEESLNDPSVFVRDYCLVGDTRIRLLNGTCPTIKELAEGVAGARFWVYSVDAEGWVVPGQAHSARLTEAQAPVFKITLDSGETIRATSNHPFLLRNGTYRRVSDLIVGDSLMPLSELKQQAPLLGLTHTVVAIQPDGFADVYDLTVDDLHNFALDAGVFVHNSLWDVKPEDYFSQKRFWVLCGNEQSASKILTPAEAGSYKDRVPDGSVLLEIPEDFRADFERDLEGSIRDIAGISTVAIHPYIQRREKIRDAIDTTLSHPFSSRVYDLSKGGTFMWDQMVAMRTERAPGRVEFQRLRPIINPNAARGGRARGRRRGRGRGRRWRGRRRGPRSGGR